MKLKFSILMLLLAIGILSNGQIKPLVTDRFETINPSDIRIEGYLGGKINLCISERIAKQDVDHLIEPFTLRNETKLWQTEFWGKWILSAIAAYEYTRSEKLFAIIQDAAQKLIATQTPDGYIGNYTPGAQLKQWDIWGRKYVLLGLLAYYDISNDSKALTAAQKVANHLFTQVGPGKTNIIKTGNYHGMPSSSILEPMVSLYRHTGEKQYLDFAKYIVAQWETAEGPKLISKALAGVNVADRFPHPRSWWSWENGQKAYEMMSCYEGLLDLYRLTGNQDYLKATEMAVKNIIDTEINVAGSCSAFECFYHGVERQTEPAYHTMETCVTFTWIKLCNNLLRLTGKSLYADQIEKTTYNALLAAMKADGTQIAKYSPIEGMHSAGEGQCGMHINCCNANGPRGFTLLPKIAVMVSANEIILNLFCSSDVKVKLAAAGIVSLSETTTYPVDNHIEITVSPEKESQFSVLLRVPAWCNKTVIKINGKPLENIPASSYLKIERIWKTGDKISVEFDMPGKVVYSKGFQAIQRGPVVLARDSRFKDGFVDETAEIQQKDNFVELKPSAEKPAEVWMAFTAPLILGTDLEGEFQYPKQVHFCDFASAGNTWEYSARYRVWIKQTLNVMNSPYRNSR